MLGGRCSREILPSWKRGIAAGTTLSDGRTRQTIIWQAPGPDLTVTCELVTWPDFPAVEWTLYFENKGTRPTAVISDIRALDVTLQRASPNGRHILHAARGGQCAPTAFEPLRIDLTSKEETVLTAGGGRSSNRYLPHFNIETRARHERYCPASRSSRVAPPARTYRVIGSNPLLRQPFRAGRGQEMRVHIAQVPAADRLRGRFRRPIDHQPAGRIRDEVAPHPLPAPAQRGDVRRARRDRVDAGEVVYDVPMMSNITGVACIALAILTGEEIAPEPVGGLSVEYMLNHRRRSGNERVRPHRWRQHMNLPLQPLHRIEKGLVPRIMLGLLLGPVVIGSANGSDHRLERPAEPSARVELRLDKGFFTGAFGQQIRQVSATFPFDVIPVHRPPSPRANAYATVGGPNQTLIRRSIFTHHMH